MPFENITNIEKPTTPVEEQEAINALVDAINWAKPNAWYIRHGGAEYKVDDVVNCPYFRDLELKCTKAGTTADNLLDKEKLVVGATITDGTVEWLVQENSASSGGSLWKIAEEGTGILPKELDNLTPEEVDTDEATIRKIVNTMLEHEAVGTMKLWPSNTAIPEGFLLCDGASVARTTYPDLFAVIGTTWGAVDDEHFNLPDMTGRFAEGAGSAGGYKEAGLPNIEGTTLTIKYGYWYPGNSSGAFEEQAIQSSLNTSHYPSSDANNIFLNNTFNASRSNAIYGNSDTVQPPSALLRYIIRAFNTVNTRAGDVDITSLANEVASAANRDLSNLTEAGRKAFFPSDTFVNIPLSLSWNTMSDIFADNFYTAPANGYIFIYFRIGSGGAWSRGWLQSKRNAMCIRNHCHSTEAFETILPVKKGDIISLHYVNVSQTEYLCRFYYAEGEV